MMMNETINNISNSIKDNTSNNLKESLDKRKYLLYLLKGYEIYAFNESEKSIKEIKNLIKGE